MRRGVWLLFLCVVAVAGFGAGSARADGLGTTTTPSTTTTDTTTTSTTTPTTTPVSYAPLSPSSLPRGCVGAGVAAIVMRARPAEAFGVGAAGLGPSSYARSSGAVLTFDSASTSGHACSSTRVMLGSLSLFDGAVSASSVEATDGRGVVTGLEVNGAAVSASVGETVAVGSWGLLRLGGTVGRVTAPLVLRLVQAHDSLPAGTVVAVAFSASALRVAKPVHAHKTSAHKLHAPNTTHTRKHRRASVHHNHKQLHRNNYWAHYTFPAGGLEAGARKNAVVSLALHYLGVPYVWAGARPRTGFDCSGLVQWVFSRLGVWLPHNAAAQWHSTTTKWVNPRRLRPGDLVFFKSDGTWKMPGHVGIYIGGGDIIDAPHTGSFVRVDSFRQRWFVRQFVGAKRVRGLKLTGLPAPVAALVSLTSRRQRLERHLRTGAHAAEAEASPVRFHGFVPAVRLGASVDPSRTRPGRASVGPTWLGLGFGSVLLVILPSVLTYRRRRPAAAAAGPRIGC